MSGLLSIRLPALRRVVPATVSHNPSNRNACQCSHPSIRQIQGGFLQSHRLSSLSLWSSQLLLAPFTTRHQSHQPARQRRELQVRAKQETKVFEIEPLSKTLVDGPLLDKEEHRQLSVVICEPEPPEALPQLVQSVLENFHEDTEPWFFQEFSLGPAYKKIDWDVSKEGISANTGPLIEGHRAILDMQSNMPETVQRDFALGHALLAAEAQVAASTAAYADKKARLAPVSASNFRTFGTTKDDVYYPDFFEGYWEVDGVLISIDVPKGMENMLPEVQLFLRGLLDKHHKIVERFIKHDGHVISDRLYNALSSHATENETMVGIWDPKRPGLWRMSTVLPELGDRFDSQHDSKVSLRAFDAGPGFFECSEFIREWEIYGLSQWTEDFPPDLSGSHVFHRYKWDANQKDGPDEMTSIMTNAKYKPWTEHCGKIPSSQEFLLEMLSRTTLPTFVAKIVMRHRRIDDPLPEEADEQDPDETQT